MLAPWFILAHEVFAALSVDPAVTVAPLDDSTEPMIETITVAETAQAVALASLLKARHDFGNISVAIVVKDASGAVAAPVVPTSPGTVADQFRAAFCGNTWFRDVVLKSVMGREQVFPVFARAVVQFPTDNLADLHFNTNKVAAEAFAELLEPAPGGFGLNLSTDTR